MPKSSAAKPALSPKVKTAPKKRNKTLAKMEPVAGATVTAQTLVSDLGLPDANKASTKPLENSIAKSSKKSAPVVKAKASPKKKGKTDKPALAKNDKAVKEIADAKSLPKKATKATKKKAAKTAEPEKSWYDYPHYYDVGFREDTPREAKFFEQAFAKYIPGKVKRVFEPGCGSGRLVVEMAERGYQVAGLDLNQPALDYCREQLDKKGLKATLINGDMTDFQLKRPADAAFNTINTFRHLLSEEDAVKHLKCVAANLRPGGIYILGLHLLPTGGDFYGSEKWKAKEGRTQISYSLTVVDSLPKERHEKLRISMTIKTGKKVVRVSDHFTLRLYNYKNIKTLFASVPELKLLDVYDFWYEIDEPQKLDGNIADSVFILQKPE